MEMNSIVSEIKRLKREKNAVIMAHNYQIPEIQDIADYVGDSLTLSKKAMTIDAEVIVFCGVKFMAETVKILNPEKKVLLPASDAGCPMADMITPERLTQYKALHPETTIVSYVNTSAEVKAASDICCTASNAVQVVESLESKDILFVPDRNLGHYINTKLKNKKMKLWASFCTTHDRVQASEIQAIRDRKPGVQIVAHPMCNPLVLEQADFIGSSTAILEYIKKSDDREFIIGTEMGILNALRKQNISKKFTLLSPALICYNMKKTSLDELKHVLKTGENEIKIDKAVQERAYQSLIKMLEIDS